MTTAESKCTVRIALLIDAPQIAAIHEASRREAYKGLMDWDLLNATPLSEREADWAKQLNEYQLCLLAPHRVL